MLKRLNLSRSKVTVTCYEYMLRIHATNEHTHKHATNKCMLATNNLSLIIN